MQNAKMNSLVLNIKYRTSIDKLKTRLSYTSNHAFQK